MKDLSPELAELIERHLSGELDATGQARLDAELARDPELADELASLERLESLLLAPVAEERAEPFLRRVEESTAARIVAAGAGVGLGMLFKKVAPWAVGGGIVVASLTAILPNRSSENASLPAPAPSEQAPTTPREPSIGQGIPSPSQQAPASPAPEAPAVQRPNQDPRVGARTEEQDPMAEVISSLRAARSTADAAGDEARVAILDKQLGVALAASGRANEARQCFDRSLATAERLGLTQLADEVRAEKEKMR